MQNFEQKSEAKMNVVIVESPAKAKTINKYLGTGYKVLSSYGHIRDLPSKDGSVDPENDFKMKWEMDSASNKRIKEIANAVKGTDTLYLATDPDREGEAISWHLLEVLNKKKALKDVKIKRVAFNAITKSAILKAMAEPRELHNELVDAYLARRALDYLVGFTLSPVLWRKLPGSRSAGRVQSVALRIVCDREREIESFISEEYWSVGVNFKNPTGAQFKARLANLDGKKIEKMSLQNEGMATEAVSKISNSGFIVTKVEKKPTRRNPYPPFTTSTLQQEASRKLGFNARRTMSVAQALYEGKNIDGETTGLITYMRTDGITIAGEALAQCRDMIAKNYGDKFLPSSPRVYKSKAKNAQEAHEAIRPTNLFRKPDDIAHALTDEEKKLYGLIWKRTVASQMEQAIVEQTKAEISAKDNSVGLRASGSVMQFEGFLKLYQEGQDDQKEEKDEKRLPPLKEGDKLDIEEVLPNQHFTEPLPRFTEASLVKKLEELGIGRPSTYASTLSVLRDRNYVHMDKNRFVPEDKGQIVTGFLENFFMRYVEYDFTANLEDQLDLISDGKKDWKETVREFWNDFHPKTEEVLAIRNTVILDALNEYLGPHVFPPLEDGGDPRKCQSCEDGKLSLKVGKFGAFVGCSNYPECNFTRKLGEENNKESMPDGPLVLGQDPETGLDISVRDGRFGAYIQVGETEKGSKPKRAGIPKDTDPKDINYEKALALLSLPRTVGDHPETGKPITSAIGRFGPYLLHDGKYASLGSSQEVFEVGLNRAVTLIAESKAGKRQGPKEIKVLGDHPDDGSPVRVMDGRYGPYINHNKTNATLTKGITPDNVDMAKALELIAAKVAKGGGRKKTSKKKTVKKKAAPKKTTKTKNKK